MSENNPYTNLSLEELLSKEASLSKLKNIYIIIAVVLVLNTFFAIYKKSIGLFHSISILVSLFFIANNSTELKKVQLEIEKRKG